MNTALSVLDTQLRLNEKAMRQFPWESKRPYAEWLAQTHFYVCHSTRLLAAAAARFPYATRQKLHLRFAAHMAQERGHELLCLRDLEDIESAVADFSESPITLALYSSQFYLIEHRDPAALLGYILFLEAMASTTGRQVCDRVIRAHGSASRFWRVHATEDVAHVEEAKAQLIWLDEKQLQVVGESILLTGSLYNQLISTIHAAHEQRPLSLQTDDEAAA